ncbi:MAG: hypothetical protein KDJ73_07640 [Notoacmeibacter sp.]|nr:hypothetical protein [Notoacmeibacter sp.]
MNRILIASALILGVTGFAAAESPVLYSGNYSASVINQYGAPGFEAPASTDHFTTASTDHFTTASTAAPQAAETAPFGNYSANIRAEDVYGR